MAQGRGNAMAILFAVVAVLAVLQAVAAKDIVVGGATQKWNYPPGTDTTYYDTWAAAQTFAVGDNLVFEYTAGAHDVQVVTQADYAGCLMSTGKTYESGNDVIALDKAGDYYFLCSFPTHCASGMKVKVTVGAAAATPPPAVAPTPPPVVAPTPPPVVAPIPPPVKAPVVPPVVAPTPPPVKAPVPAPVKAPVAAPVPAPVKAPVPAPVKAPVVAPVPAPVKAPTPVPSVVPAPTPVPETSPVAEPTPPVVQGPAVSPTPPPGSSGNSLCACLSIVGAAAVVAFGALLF